MSDNFFDTMFTASLLGGGGGSAPVIVSKSITANGTYQAAADNADGFDPVTVNVQPDLITKNITANGTYSAAADNADGYSSVSVSVQPNVGTKNITANGTYNASSDSLDGYSSVSVDVPNTYTAGDEGKVVSNGALVAQTAYPSTITENGTYNTTENNSITVNVPTGINVYSCRYSTLNNNTSILWNADNIKYYYNSTSKKLHIYGWCSCSYNGSLAIAFQSKLSDIGVPNTQSTGYIYTIQGGDVSSTRLCGASKRTISGDSITIDIQALYNVTTHYVVGEFQFN